MIGRLYYILISKKLKLKIKQLFLGRSEKWVHRANHHLQNWRDRHTDTEHHNLLEQNPWVGISVGTSTGKEKPKLWQIARYLVWTSLRAKNPGLGWGSHKVVSHTFDSLTSRSSLRFTWWVVEKESPCVSRMSWGKVTFWNMLENSVLLNKVCPQEKQSYQNLTYQVFFRA